MDGRLEGALVLVVEDDYLIRQIIVGVLEELGVRVAVASDGASGLELGGRLKPDLVLLDINLPMLSGLEVARRLKADPSTRSIPIVAVTAQSCVKTLAAGCDDHLDKPFGLDQLADKALVYLDRDRSR